MNWRQRSESLLEASRRVLGLGTNVALLAIMAAVSLDAVLRYAFNRPIVGVLEGVELLLVFAVFASLARTQAEGGHIAIGVLTERLGARGRAGLQIITRLLGLSLFATMTWASGGMAWRSWQMDEFSAGIIAFPVYPSRIMVTLGCFLLCLQLLFELAEAVATVRTSRGGNN